jgi:hypothetical protein
MSSDGTTVVIPAGALKQEVVITVAPNPCALELLQAHPLAVAHQFGPEGQTFLKPVSVTLAFNAANLPVGASLQSVLIFSAPSNSDLYSVLDTQLTDSSHVTATTTQFCNMYPGANAGL